MAPQSTRKNRAVCKKKPVAVGQPSLSAINMAHPNTFCVILYVSGFAIIKNMSVE